jgi:hypothetical protein
MHTQAAMQRVCALLGPSLPQPPSACLHTHARSHAAACHAGAACQFEREGAHDGFYGEAPYSHHPHYYPPAPAPYVHHPKPPQYVVGRARPGVQGGGGGMFPLACSASVQPLTRSSHTATCAHGPPHNTLQHGSTRQKYGKEAPAHGHSSKHPAGSKPTKPRHSGPHTTAKPHAYYAEEGAPEGLLEDFQQYGSSSGTASKAQQQ